MPEWWTYGLSDFLLFSPRTYYRLLQRHNEALWPAQIVTLALGLFILVLLRRPSPRQGRIISTMVAGLWAWSAWAFLWNRYATINWAATYAVPMFGLEALFFGWIGTVKGRLTYRASRGAAGVVGMSLLLVGLATYPLLAPVFGRPWPQAEVFGVTPDPTVLATLGLLALAEGARRGALIVVPMLWSLFSGATLVAMGSPEAWVQLSAPFVVLLGIVWSRWTTKSLTMKYQP
jgi:uncharacterized protein DUF6064